MDNNTLKELIENYDENILFLESLEEEKNKKESILSKQLKNWIFRFAQNETDADFVMRELLLNLKKFTRTKQKAQKELDFVRTQSDRLGYEFEPVAKVYAQEFFPAATGDGLNKKEIHNLFRAIGEFSASQNASTDMFCKLLLQIADSFKNGIKPDRSFLKNSILPDINIEVRETLDRTKSKSTQIFYENFANLLHFKYKNSSLENVDYYIAERNRQKNEVFDHAPIGIGFKNILLSLTGITSAGEPILKKLNVLSKTGLSPFLIMLLFGTLSADILSSKSKRKERYKNSFEYDNFTGEQGFFTPEEAKKIYGTIEMYVPFKGTKMYADPNFPNVAPVLKQRIEEYNERSSLPLNISSGAFNFNISSLSPNDTAQEVRQVLVSVFDDIARVRGYQSYSND